MFRMLSAAAIACAAPVTLAHAQSTTNTGYAQVLDANSKVMGPLVSQFYSGSTGFFSSNAVLTKIGQYTLSIPVSPTGFVNLYGYQIYYSAANCAGTRYLRADVPVTAIVQTNSQLIFAKPPFENVTFKSILSVNGTKKTCGTAGGTVYAGPVGSYAASVLGFTPPFSVRLAP